MKQKKLKVSETSKILADELRREMDKLDNKKIREATVKKWESLGFLDGLKGHVKDNIAQLYENEASALLNEVKKDGDK